MKFIMVSKYGEGAHVLSRIEREGNDVSLFITEKECKDRWNNLLPKSTRLEDDKDAVYIFDMTGNGKVADDLRVKGHKVVGSSHFADVLEEDRLFGIEVMEKCGIEVPHTEHFTDFDKARSFVEQVEDIYVFKPCGRGIPSKLTYIPSDQEDLYRYFKYLEKSFGKMEFILQKFIKGVAISTEGWFDGSKFIPPFNHTIENKKYANDNLGPSTGCQGDIVWVCDRDDLVNELLKCEKFFNGKHVGPIDINCIVTDDGIYGLEWTPRFGYDSIPTYLAMYEGELGKLFSDLAQRTLKEQELTSKVGAALRITIPPYPFEPMEDEKLHDTKEIPIQGIDSSKSDNYYFYEVMLDDEGDFVHSGGTGLILCTLGVDDELEDAFDTCYELAEEIKIPDKHYRTDLLKVISEDWDKFEEVKEHARAD